MATFTGVIMAPKGKKRPHTRGGSSPTGGSVTRGPSQGFVGESEEESYIGATSLPEYDINIT